MDDSGRKNAAALSAQDVAEEKIRSKTLAQQARELFFGALYALWGYVLGGCALPFGATPFGFALLCASESRTLWVFAGLCLSVIGKSHAIVTVCSYAVAVVIRILANFLLEAPKEKNGADGALGAWQFVFREHLSLRMCTACVSALALGVYLLARGGFLYYDLYGALISLSVAPVAACAFAGLFGERSENVIWRRIGFIALACVLVYATRSLEIYHVSISAFGALFASLYLVRKEGTVSGVLAGALTGLCYSPTLSPLFAFGALCGGIVFPTSVTLGTVATFTVGTAWALYTKGLGALSGLLPAILSASVLYAAVDKLFLSEKAADVKTEALQKESEGAKDVAIDLLDSTQLDGMRLDDSESRVRAVCDSFRALSGVFESMAEMMKKPCEEDLRRICDNAFDSSCAGCSQREGCWEKNYRSTELEISKLCAALHREGSVCSRDAGASLVSRCARLPDILDEINHNANAHLSRILQYDKTEIFAGDYSVMSEILSGAMERGSEEYLLDSSTSEKLSSKLVESGAEVAREVKAVAVFGMRQKRVALAISKFEAEENVDVKESFEKRFSELVRISEEICGCGFSVERVDTLANGDAAVMLCQTPRLSVSCVSRSKKADGEEEYCGDSSGYFKNRDGRFYAFISDGMGAGRDAAVTSGICSLFLKKMLSSGVACESALRMINGFLRNKGSGSLHECSATVDLWELDLLNGKASFCKSGAAPTYVLRDGALFKIRSKTLPIGILSEPDTKRIGFDVGAGDVVVMVSDGITQGKEDCPWLYDLLRGNISTLGTEKTADLVIEYAKNEGSSDDMSVLIMSVE